MLPYLLRGLAAVLLTVSLSLPFAAGQGDPSLPSVQRGVSKDAVETEKSSSSPSALPHFVLAVYTMLVLTIVCMPSRKA